MLPCKAKLIDEIQYEGLLETIRILQESPTIALSLAERENDDFISEEEFMEIYYECKIGLVPKSPLSSPLSTL